MHLSLFSLLGIVYPGWEEHPLIEQYFSIVFKGIWGESCIQRGRIQY
jgi:hypothetical protein